MKEVCSGNPSHEAESSIQAQAEYSVARLPEHQLALGRALKQIFDDLYMIFDPVRERTGAKHDSVQLKSIFPRDAEGPGKRKSRWRRTCPAPG